MAEKKAFALRISPDIWDALQRLAEEEFRSVNGQIESMLADALRRSGRLQGEPAEDDKES